MKRRSLLLGTAGLTAAALGGLGYRYMPPSPSDYLRPLRELAVELFNSLDSTQQAAMVVDYDHPLRQYHNRGVWTGGELIANAGFSRQQLSLATDLFHAGLSPGGRAVIPEQYFQTLPRALVHNLLFCGDPSSERCQIMITGPHLNLRLGGSSVEGVAFGGPQVYGDQRGNEEPGLPGNIYQPTLIAGMALFNALSPEEQAAALLEESPVQTQIELQGKAGVFPGIPVGMLNTENRGRVSALVDLILAPYGEDDVLYARECLAANGGVEGMSLSYYRDSTYDLDNPIYQTFRLEGPAAVFYFRGFPHVHAFFNIAMEGDRPLSVGQIVGSSPGTIEKENMQALLEAAMLSETGADVAYYNLDSVVGKLRPGVIRTGDLYNAESWQSTVIVADVLGRDLADKLRVPDPEPDRIYRVATTDYVANDRLDEIGSVQDTSEAGLLRDMLIDHVRQHGFSRTAG